MGLREEHRELTRRKVLGAVLELVAEGSLDEVSIPAVARRSEVSAATIYRYFPSKSDLLAAASAEPARLALSSTDRPQRQEGDDEFATFMRTMWHEFGKNLPLLRHQISSESGREMRRERFDENRRRLAEYVQRFGVDPSSPEGERLISLVMVVSGSIALVEFRDRQEVSVDAAIDRSLWAVRALIDSTVREALGPNGEAST